MSTDSASNPDSAAHPETPRVFGYRGRIVGQPQVEAWNPSDEETVDSRLPLPETPPRGWTLHPKLASQPPAPPPAVTEPVAAVSEPESPPAKPAEPAAQSKPPVAPAEKSSGLPRPETPHDKLLRTVVMAAVYSPGKVGVEERGDEEGAVPILQKVAVLMVTLGQETTGEILKFLSDFEIEEITQATNPQFMRISAASEIVILLAFEVNSTNASGLVSLCYPFFTLEPILSRLGEQTYHQPPKRDSEQRQLDNRLRLGSMELPVTVELGNAELTVAEVGDLCPGDVLRTQTRLDEPVVIPVGSRPKYLAYPYTSADGDVRLKVAGPIKP
jgi:flagellar motor switch/type III secretory pathway protein FliN